MINRNNHFLYWIRIRNDSIRLRVRFGGQEGLGLISLKLAADKRRKLALGFIPLIMVNNDSQNLKGGMVMKDWGYKRIALRLLSIMGLLLVLSGCWISVEKDTELLTAEFTTKDNKEAELMALCLSGDLTAPDDLYNQVLSDLAAIRSLFGDDIEPLKHITFTPPWRPGCLIIGFDYARAQEVADGNYHAWDDLNKEYQVIEIDTNSTDSIGFAILNFKHRLHPRPLGQLYDGLPGVEYTEPNYLVGDFSNIYPRKQGDGITYLFREAWGDCPSGCNSQYWYFTFEGNQPVFIGEWAPNDVSQEPDWWDKAEQNIEQFHEW